MVISDKTHVRVELHFMARVYGRLCDPVNVLSPGLGRLRSFLYDTRMAVDDTFDQPRISRSRHAVVKRELLGRSDYHPNFRRRGQYRRHGTKLRRWILWLSVIGLVAVLIYAWREHTKGPAQSKLQDLERMQDLLKDRSHKDRPK